MKCPKCGYEQAIYDDINEWWHCPQCHGTGEVQMTNDEWRRTCSTEEFAKWIYDIRFDFQIPWKNKEIVQWLKEKHE